MIQKLIKEVPRALIISVSVFLVLVVIRLISGINVAVNKDLVINFGYTFLTDLPYILLTRYCSFI